MSFPIPFRKPALSLLLLLLVVPFSSSSTGGSQQQLSATRLLSEADLCASTPQPSSCPINCFRADPVCGDDGVTYWCGCADAHCAGAKVVKIGFCEVGNSGGNGSFPGQALLLVHILWLIVLGFSVLFGLI
ncbi:Serine-type endopeptidase inhibitor [Theobroma cacao]|uniref:Serine-type endopeptidase inhibitor n=1 Tax=Theobroma cacao TaxID=3641 RepID=A0A061G1N9_THECC|nr:Serine-type endopeptidase inhibitor [Theobroma cacao]